MYDSPINTVIKEFFADPSWTSTNPLHFSFHHEQYVKAEGGSIAAGSAQDFIAAYRHVRSLVDQANAHVSQGGERHVLTPHWRQYYHDPVYGIGGGTTAVKPLVTSLSQPGHIVDMLGWICTTEAQFYISRLGQVDPWQHSHTQLTPHL